MRHRKIFTLFLGSVIFLFVSTVTSYIFLVSKKSNQGADGDRNVISILANLSPRQGLNLTEVFTQLVQQNKLKDCPYYENCFDNILSPNVRADLARKYGVADTTSDETDIIIGLHKGNSVDIPGIGTGYLENKNRLNLKPDRWYWEIGACSTNNRIFIDAVTGQQSLLHQYTYCGGMP